MEEKIREYFDRLSSYFEPLPVGVVVIGQDGRVVYANSRAAGLCGRRPDPGAEMDLIPVRYVLQGGEEHAREMVITRPDGTRIIASVSAAPIKDADGMVIGAFITIEELAEAEEVRFSMLALATFEGVIVAEQGIIRDANEQAGNLFGCSLKEMAGRPVKDFLIPIQDSEQGAGKYMVTRRDGSIAYVEARSREFSGNHRRRCVIVLRDISESKRTERFNVALHRINASIHSSLNPDALLRAVLSEAGQVLGAVNAVVLSWENGVWRVRYVWGFPEEKGIAGLEMRDEEIPYALLCLRLGKPVPVRDVLTDPQADSARMREWGIRAVLAVPLMGEETAGVIFFNFSENTDFRLSHIDFAEKLACTVSLAMKNALIFSRLEERVGEQTRIIRGAYELLASVGKELVHAQDARAMVAAVCGKAMRHLGCQVFFNFLLDEKTGRLRLNCCDGVSAEAAKRIEWLDRETAVCGCVAEDAAPIILDHTAILNDARAQLVREFAITAYAGFPLFGPDNRVIGTLSFGSRERGSFSAEDVSLMRAFSDQVSVAMLRLRNEEALRESERSWRTLADSLPVMVWTFDSRGICDYCSRQWTVYSGVPVGQLTGNGWAGYVHPDDIGQLLDGWARAVKEKTDFEGEFRFRRHDGEYNWFKSRAVPVRDDRGIVVKWFGSNSNIQDSKLAEDILKRDKEIFANLVKERTGDLLDARLELERSRKLSDIGTLATTVAHELRNPLAAIHMAAVNIGKKTQDIALYGHLATIQKKVVESDLIISNLLFYSRLKEPMLVPVRIHETVSESLSVSRARAHSRSIMFDVDLEGVKETVIDADQVQVKEVFNNILNNAIDAIPPQVKGIIAIRGVVENGRFVLTVRDNGVGIDRGNMEKIFEPFFTTKSRGTGLGLTVCWQIVKLHKGEIIVESEPGKGTLVRVELPLINHPAVRRSSRKSGKKSE